MGKIILTWQPFRRLSEFPQQWPEEATKEIQGKKPRMDYKLVRCPCIYLWGFVHEGWFIPYCVGKSNRPFERAMQHYANLRGGLYPIYHRNSLAEFHRYKDDKADSTRPFGKIYSPDSPRALAEIFPSQIVQDEVKYLLDAFRFSYATWTEDGYSTGMIEEAVADCLEHQYLQSSVAKSKNGCVVEFGHAKNESIQELFKQTRITPRRVQMS